MVAVWSYPPPLDRLFTYGDPRSGTEKGMPDYVAELGLTPEHLPALIEIARLWEDVEDLPEDDSCFAPIHAWRALGQLRAIEAVEPLLNMLNRLDEMDDDWYLDEFPAVVASIGPVAIPQLASYLGDRLNREYARVAAAVALRKIAKQYPDSRDEVVKLLIEQVSRNEEGLYALNGLVVCDLLDLKAAEAAEAIERAFAANVIDETICGDWGEVRKELGVPGLGLAPDKPPRPHFDRFPHFSDAPLRFVEDDRDRQRKAEKKAKAQRKQQEKARKRNRKRR
jgi:hypothetical protein